MPWTITPFMNQEGYYSARDEKECIYCIIIKGMRANLYTERGACILDFPLDAIDHTSIQKALDRCLGPHAYRWKHFLHTIIGMTMAKNDGRIFLTKSVPDVLHILVEHYPRRFLELGRPCWKDVDGLETIYNPWIWGRDTVGIAFGGWKTAHERFSSFQESQILLQEAASNVGLDGKYLLQQIDAW